MNHNIPKRGYKQTSEHIRHKIESHQEYWESLRGKSIPKEIVDKQIQGRLRYYQSHDTPNIGISHTETTRKKISKAMKKYWYNKKKKAGG